MPEEFCAAEGVFRLPDDPDELRLEIDMLNRNLASITGQNETLRRRLTAIERQLIEAQDYAFNLLTQLEQIKENGHGGDQA